MKLVPWDRGRGKKGHETGLEDLSGKQGAYKGWLWIHDHTLQKTWKWLVSFHTKAESMLYFWQVRKEALARTNLLAKQLSFAQLSKTAAHNTTARNGEQSLVNMAPSQNGINLQEPQDLFVGCTFSFSNWATKSGMHTSCQEHLDTLLQPSAP